MDENRRGNERFGVNLYVEQVERETRPARILNLSASGFLIRGDVCAGQGGILHASFHVRPSAGEVQVSTRGTVVHSRFDGGEMEFGIRIESFGSPLEESAYGDYVRELSLRQAAGQSPRLPEMDLR
jgi:hypothetical protein